MWAAGLIGVEVPLNLVFFVSLAVLFFVSVQQSAELTALESKTRVLAETVALLELRIERLEESSSRPSAAEPVEHQVGRDAEHRGKTQRKGRPSDNVDRDEQ